ncbi:MAG TPA: pilus assembly PilX N-terminal domain-containing protein [Noviherbaspirillum sp.]
MKPVGPPCEQGAVLLTALVMLVALMLGAASLMRMVESTNQLAGNLAFKRAATLAAESGIEAAIDWLEQQSAPTLESDATATGYYASANVAVDASGNAAASATAAIDWKNNECDGLARSACLKTMALPGVDSAGHSVRYLIQRLCSGNGGLVASGECALYLESEAESGSRSAIAYGSDKRLAGQPWAFYRITARAVGPRDTVGLVQVLVRW